MSFRGPADLTSISTIAFCKNNNDREINNSKTTTYTGFGTKISLCGTHPENSDQSAKIPTNQRGDSVFPPLGYVLLHN